MKRNVLQIPIDPALRRDAEKQALEQGFSSVQAVVRLFLKKFAKGVISVGFEEEVQLSERAEKRYLKIEEDFRKGKNIYTAKDVDDLMKQLHDHSIS